MLVMNSSAGRFFPVGRYVNSTNLFPSLTARWPSQRHKRVFHASAQNPAAQQQGVHLVTVGLRLIHHDADKPIIPKSIDHANHQTAGVFTLQEVFDLILRAPDGREVELICSERQLRDTAELIFRRFGNLDAKLKSFDEILQGE